MLLYRPDLDIYVHIVNRNRALLFLQKRVKTYIFRPQEF